MKIINWFSAICCFAVFSVAGIASGQDSHLADNREQSAPPSPELFLPHLLNWPEGYHSPPVFDETETCFYLSPMTTGETMQMFRLEHNGWTGPHDPKMDAGIPGSDPNLSPSGNALYFLSFEPPTPGAVGRERIWTATRTPDGWSVPRLLDPGISTHPTHWTFSVTAAGTVYFMSEISGGQDIWQARRSGSGFAEPDRLPETINTDAREFCPFVTDDEQLIIFARIGPGTRKADLYASKRQPDGRWQTARPLRGVNTEAHDLAPSLSRDGQYLYFLSTRSGTSRVYRVQATGLFDRCDSGKHK